MKKQYGEYYLGLDIGTSSVGWAVTDLNYKVMKFNGKSMWGIRLFDEAKTAEERRLFRGARRRNARETQRIRLLQELFAEEISKVDFGFFMRLKESKLWQEDKTELQTNGIFNDTDYQDSEYFYQYPTIYHLRRELMKDAREHDVRLVYLAIHHILKHRGHFLYPGEFSDVSELKMEPMMMALKEVVEEHLGINFDYQNLDDCKVVLCDPEINVTNKKKRFENIFIYEKDDAKSMKAIIALLSKGTVKLCDLFSDESLKETEPKSISFMGTGYEDNEQAYRAALQDKFALIERLKSLYDWGVLQYVLSGEKSISSAKAKEYDQHHADLLLLKKAVKQYCPQKYKMVFGKPKDQSKNYSAYVGTCDINGKKQIIEKTCTQDEFCEFLRKTIFKDIAIDAGMFPGLQDRIENAVLLPKQRNKNNSVIPFQLHRQELICILENASNYLPFLNEKDENQISVKNKILSILAYRIPYYVGPVNLAHSQEGKGFSWAVKNSNAPVRPWNINETINLEESAERFIRRMTNKCTYLHGEDVIPKESLLYSQYVVLNELNNLRINGEKISVTLKKELYEELFLKHKRVTAKTLKSYFVSLGYGADLEITGVDGDFKASMTAYIDFKEILKKDSFTDAEKEMIEEIIKYIVLFGEDKKILKNKIEKLYSKTLSEEQIKQCLGKKYSGWGRLSKRFLTGLFMIDESTGEYLSILSLLSHHPDNPNLMQLLSNDFPFSRKIEEENNFENQEKTVTYEDLNDLYVSVPVKRSIWQTLTIIGELTKILGHEPKKVFVEMAKGPDSKPGGRVLSRQKQLLELYKACKLDERQLYEELEMKSDQELRKDKLYLYYMQLGHCMYSGKKIELDSLSEYDIDHIYPQSKVMDDSLDNRVLVHKTLNGKKGDVYPLSEEIRRTQKDLWKMLYQKNLISKVKYERLIRNTPFSEGELVGFVSRQIVETRQSTKAVAQLLSKLFQNTEIVYVKANNVAEFRRGINDYEEKKKNDEVNARKESNKFIKCRSINDYHHAKDAYLNIVVGNVFHSKFTRDPRNFFKENKAYSFNAMYRFPISRDNVIAWEPVNDGCDGTMSLVKAQMRKNDIQYTRYAKVAKGGLFDQTIMKKGKGQVKLKATGPLSSIDKYGGYDSAKSAYFFIVEHMKKGQKVRTIETVLAYKKEDVRTREELLRYCTEFLKLVQPRVLVDKVKVDTLLELDGFRMHITGRQNDSYYIRCAIQLMLNSELEMYVKKIEAFMKKKKDNKELTITSFDQINAEMNIHLYKEFIQKIKESVYGVKLSGQAANLETGFETFKGLLPEEQSEVLLEILNFFKCDRVSSNLTLIGGAKNAGVLALGKNVTSLPDLYLIHQSPSGLFEQRIKISAL